MKASIVRCKIDVEGAEELVLRGAAPLLVCRPGILFEVNPRAAKSLGLDPHGAWELLAGQGYVFYSMPKRGRLVECEAPPDGGNVLALPQKYAEPESIAFGP